MWQIVHDLFDVENPPADHIRPPCCDSGLPVLDDQELADFMNALRKLLRAPARPGLGRRASRQPVGKSRRTARRNRAPRAAARMAGARATLARRANCPTGLGSRVCTIGGGVRLVGSCALKPTVWWCGYPCRRPGSSVTTWGVMPRPVSITSSGPPPRRDRSVRFWVESLERTKVLAPGAIAKITFVNLTLRVRVETVRLPSRRVMSRSRTVTVASASPVHTPPSPSQASASERRLHSASARSGCWRCRPGRAP